MSDVRQKLEQLRYLVFYKQNEKTQEKLDLISEIEDLIKED